MKIQTIPTENFSDQKPGTSGLRKKVSVFQQTHYIENFVQSIFNSCQDIQGKTLVLGGDGRFYMDEVLQIILKMAAANYIGKIIIGQKGLLSTPSVSHLIRKYKAYGGIILSASHNPGGKNGDFGIKYNMANGGSANEKLTQSFYAETQHIKYYKILDAADIDLSEQGHTRLGDMEIEIIDSVADYATLMEEIFDFDQIRQAREQGLKFCYDAMHAVTGPYAYEIFVRRLGFPETSLFRCQPLPDFGGSHPDPNRHYAQALFSMMMAEDAPTLGAASDGDGDRHLILGKQQFVSPSDSLAIILANAPLIKSYDKTISGIARSMPTSSAVDYVARKRNIACYETPTGWKFFGNLLDAGKIVFCGEESFGAGSDHIREKDGLWAILFWLNLLAASGKNVQQIVQEHWQEFGRCYYMRHDYEEIPTETAHKFMERLKNLAQNWQSAQKESEIAALHEKFAPLKIIKIDDFSYTDPIDESVTKGQGIRIFLKDHARIVYRLSGTGTVGATLRIYMEQYSQDPNCLHADVGEKIAPLMRFHQEISALSQILGRVEPDMVT